MAFHITIFDWCRDSAENITLGESAHGSFVHLSLNVLVFVCQIRPPPISFFPSPIIQDSNWFGLEKVNKIKKILASLWSDELLSVKSFKLMHVIG